MKCCYCCCMDRKIKQICKQVCPGGSGKDGLSAYEVAVSQGYVGTLEEWLESLKGTNGKDGINGTNGTNGKDGVDGKDGAKGDKGDKGEPGTANLTGINAQAQSQMAKGVLSGSRVMLDTVIFNNSSIVFDSTGFTVPVGIYKIDWQVSFSNSSSVPTTCSVYKDNVIYATASVSLQTGQLSGSTIMEVTAGTVDVSIRNNTGANITLSSTPVQANITIIKIG